MGHLLSPIADYYSECALRHGATPLGVDWTCIATQQMRFVQLLRVCDLSRPASIDDIGCGYAALRRFIAQQAPDWTIDYLGIDISPEMVRLGQAEVGHWPNAAVVLGPASPRQADYTIASGIFNVCLDHASEKWIELIEIALYTMVESSRRGVAVNFLGPIAGSTRPGLYHTAPERWVRFCERLGAGVELVAGYGMGEFTLLLR